MWIQGSCHGFDNWPHRLNSVWKDNFPIRFTFWFVVASMMNKLHLLEHSWLNRKRQHLFSLSAGKTTPLTFPDSPAPRSNILISFFAIIRSRFSWLSISSLPEKIIQQLDFEQGGEREGNIRAFASSSIPVDCTQPIVIAGCFAKCGYTVVWEIEYKKTREGEVWV